MRAAQPVVHHVMRTWGPAHEVCPQLVAWPGPHATLLPHLAVPTTSWPPPLLPNPLPTHACLPSQMTFFVAFVAMDVRREERAKQGHG